MFLYFFYDVKYHGKHYNGNGGIKSKPLRCFRYSETSFINSQRRNNINEE